MSNTVALLRTVKSSWRIVRSVQTVSVANGPYSDHIRSVHLIMTSEDSVLRFLRSVRSVRIVTVQMQRAVDGSYAPYETVIVANGPYSEYIRSVHLIMTSGHSVLTFHTVRTIRANRNGQCAWLIRTVLIRRYISYISVKAKQARSNSNIPRSISHKPQQARYKCNIPRSINHKPQEARFKYNIFRSISHILKQARFKCNIPRSISHKPKQARFKCNVPLSISHKPQQARSKCNTPRSISHKPQEARSKRNIPRPISYKPQEVRTLQM